MTTEENCCWFHLLEAKRNAKDAYKALDPAPADPLAVALLAVMDAIDQAVRELKAREAV